MKTLTTAQSIAKDARTLRRVFKPSLDAQRVLLAAPLPTIRVVAAIALERERQEQLMAAGKFPFTCASKLATDHDKLPVLGEEHGEVCKELNERKPGWRRRLRTELIQLAAVATAWAESIEETNHEGTKARNGGHSCP